MMNNPLLRHRTARKAFRILTSTAALLLLTLTVVGAGNDAPKPQVFDSLVAKVVAQLASTQHYAQRPLNDALSQQLFDEYLDSLDRNRQFFLASDIEEFRIHRDELDDMLMAGDLSFPFDVYARLLQRIRERVEYAREVLQEPLDLTVDEDVQIDRSELPWCEDVDELNEVWRKLLKNRYLVYYLMAEEEEAVAADTEPAAGDSPDTVAQTDAGAPEAEAGPTAPPAKTPAQRALDFQERYLHYAEENEAMDVLELFLTSLMRVYDPHSAYMAPSTEEDFDINMSLSLEGIGAVLTSEDGYVKIVSIIPGGPAELDGRLREGDRIVAVTQDNGDTADVIDMPLRKAVRLIRGPKGSQVTLSVIEAGKSLGSAPTNIALTRDEVKLTDQGAKAKIVEVALPLAATVGESDATPGETETAQVQVIALPSFYADFSGKRNGETEYRSASRDVRQLLEEGLAARVDAVVLDLRGNGGGSLEEAIKVAGLFFTKGSVVQVRSIGGKTTVYDDPDADIVYSGPLAVLVDRFSASASEIVAAALQDHHRAVIIGSHATHGKGTVQTVLDLKRFFTRHPLFHNEQTGSLKFTIAKFYRINGGSVQRKGVTPDITFPAFADHMKIGEETLDHALLWDEITPLKVDFPNDVTPYLPLLKAHSAERLAESPLFKEWETAIDHYGEVVNRDTLTLNLDKRRALQKQEEEWSEKARQQFLPQNPEMPTDADPETAADEGEDKALDLVLQEALNIMSDLAWMQHGELLATQPETGTQPSVPKE